MKWAMLGVGIMNVVMAFNAAHWVLIPIHIVCALYLFWCFVGHYLHDEGHVTNHDIRRAREQREQDAINHPGPWTLP